MKQSDISTVSNKISRRNSHPMNKRKSVGYNKDYHKRQTPMVKVFSDLISGHVTNIT